VNTPNNSSSDTKTLADWARAYRERGWAPIPLKPNDKAPESPGWQTQRIADDRIDTVFADGKNIGLLLGPPSGNLLDIDLDCAEAVRLAAAFLPTTELVFGRLSKPDSHYLYQADPAGTVRRVQFSDPDGTLLLEIRGEGHQTMAPASVHPDGEQLDWSVFEQAGQTTVAELEKRAGWLAAAAMLGRHWPEWDHRRHFVALHLSGGLLRAGFKLDAVKSFMKSVCLIGGENDWADREKAIDSTFEKLEAGTDEVSGFPKLTEVIGNDYVKRLMEWLQVPRSGRPLGDLTDTGNAERLAKRHGDDLMYCGPHGKWYVWDGARFATDDTGAVVERMVETARSIFDEAKDAPDDKRTSLSKFAAASLNRPRIEAAIALARSKPGIAITPDQLDRDSYFLNVQNGTINLMTGGLQSHSREDRITKLAPVAFDPDAEAPVFRSFLDRAMKGDADLIAFLQCMAGYCLTGDVSEQVFFFLYGDGQNGKSKFVEALQMIMGDYAGKLPPGVLTRQKYGSDATDLQDLPGKRLVVTNETARGGVLDDALIKDMTGGDRLVGRKLYGSPFEFAPTHKIVMYGNHKPRFSGTDRGIRRRPLLIPFDVTIPDDERDPHLSERFARELPGILAWAVEGCLMWRRDGLKVPEKVREATDAYLDESDPTKRFLAECTVPGDRVLRDQVFAAYTAWAKQSGEEPATKTDFLRDLTRLGIPGFQSNNKFYRKGIRLALEWSTRTPPQEFTVVDSDGDRGKAAD
jgi:P4 family phage/plasmid primase-like protien